MRELRQVPERLEIRQFTDIVGREDEGRQVRDRGCDGGMDVGDAVAREEQRSEAGGEGEVCYRGNVVVREIYRVLALWTSHHQSVARFPRAKLQFIHSELCQKKC